ncbi:MAG: PqqD family protein [Acholeplasmataceae bacterium]|jgi:hypothetical protein|nr:PqqD family protein [Acholeplasmataceae bacterium]
MKIKPGFIIKEIAGRSVVVATGDEALDFNFIIHLNDSAKLLFEALKEEKSEEDLVKLLTDTYDVSFYEAEKDVAAFIETLKEKGIV